MAVHHDGQRLGRAQGVRDALDILIAKHRLPESEDLKVLVLAGDGSTYDMGLSPTSAAIHRGLDFWYLCYDNEAYGNTGFQTSAASPLGSRTATSPGPRSPTQRRTSSRSGGLTSAVRRDRLGARTRRLGRESLPSHEAARPKLFLSLAVCPTGWGFDPELSDEIAKLAIETGVWPLKEAIDGKVRHTLIPTRLKPVEEYLKPQRRFRQLFFPVRDEAALGQIQANVNKYWNDVREAEQVREPVLAN